VSCNKPSNKLDIILSKGEIVDSSYINMNFICLKNKDSIIYKITKPVRFNYIDTLKFDSLSDGEYELEYIDIVGNTIVNKFRLKDNISKSIRIVCDSIMSKSFYPIIPFNNLKDNESYTIERKGGCVATMFSYYKIFRSKNDYYYESLNIHKKLLKDEEIKNIQKFEAELLAINGKGTCGGTGRMTYKIIKNKMGRSITDHACNWHEFENMMSKVNRDEK
jgi:hypothetical protein